MYKQENKAGMIQFILTLIVCFAVWTVCSFLSILIKNSLISDIIYVLVSAVIVYLIYVHYCAVFFYEVKNKKLIFTRKTGRRISKEIEVPFGRINSVSYDKPQKLPKETMNFAVSVFNRKKYCYLIYDKKTKCIIFEPDKRLFEILSTKNDETE